MIDWPDGPVTQQRPPRSELRACDDGNQIVRSQCTCQFRRSAEGLQRTTRANVFAGNAKESPTTIHAIIRLPVTDAGKH